MPISIKNPRADELADALVKETGETYTDAIIHALNERLERIRGQKNLCHVKAAIQALCQQYKSLPDLDSRTPDEILGYTEDGTL